MQKKADNFWQILGFCLPTIQRFAQFFCQRNWINIFFWRKNKNIFGKTLDFVNQRPCGFGNFLPQKSGLAFFLPKNENISGKILDFVYERPGGFGNFLCSKRVDWHFFCQKTKLFLAKTWISSTNDQVVLANLSPKKSGLAFFLPKNENWHDIKIGKNTKNAILVNLFWFVDQNQNLRTFSRYDFMLKLVSLWSYCWKRNVKVVKIFLSLFFLLLRQVLAPPLWGEGVLTFLALWKYFWTFLANKTFFGICCSETFIWNLAFWNFLPRVVLKMSFGSCAFEKFLALVITKMHFKLVVSRFRDNLFCWLSYHEYVFLGKRQMKKKVAILTNWKKHHHCHFRQVFSICWLSKV